MLRMKVPVKMHQCCKHIGSCRWVSFLRDVRRASKADLLLHVQMVGSLQKEQRPLVKGKA